MIYKCFVLTDCVCDYREVVQKRERIVVNGVDPADPVSGLLKTGTTPLRRGRKGEPTINARREPSPGVMLGRRRRRRTNIYPALAQYVLLADRAVK